MKRTLVPTAAEIAEINKKRAKGISPGPPGEVALQRRVKELEAQLAVLSAPGQLTPAELRSNLDDILRKYGVEPAEEVVKLLTPDIHGNFQLGPKDRAALWMELLQYRMPKLRSVEHSGKVDSNLTLVIMKYATGEVIEKKAIMLDADPIEVEIGKTK